MADAPFLIGTALAAGLSAKRLRGRDLDASTWGVRAAGPQGALASRCAKFATRMPHDAFFSHVTAALLLKAPLPFELERRASLDISVLRPARAPHARGILGHSLDITAGDVVSTAGILHTSPARTWCDLAAVLSLTDLVAVGDHLIHHSLPLTTADELSRVSRRFVGRRGMSRIREGLPLLNDRAESRPESALRVILHLAGLPTPQVNHVIVDTEDGAVMRTDLAFEEWRVLLEYQGDYHRLTRQQWRKDMTRRSRLEAGGWKVVELNADDLKDSVELTARIRTVLRRQGWSS